MESRCEERSIFGRMKGGRADGREVAYSTPIEFTARPGCAEFISLLDLPHALFQNATTHGCRGASGDRTSIDVI